MLYLDSGNITLTARVSSFHKMRHKNPFLLTISYQNELKPAWSIVVSLWNESHSECKCACCCYCCCWKRSWATLLRRLDYHRHCSCFDEWFSLEIVCFYRVLRHKNSIKNIFALIVFLVKLIRVFFCDLNRKLK